ncbi:MAG: alpha/beta hydrolase [Alphaproteobacteria bacterium]|nr:MAG: alpha/beta hydrolase [Alphaproteobacteria bacterium]
MPFGQIEAFEQDGVRLAVERQTGRAPTFVWLGGFKSDMAGTKAEALARWAEARGQGFVRFDYFGHGQSGGAFEDGTISRWLDDVLAVIDRLTDGPLVLVGSSMGGWLALLAARQRPARIASLLLIAPAADFTERLIWDGMSADEQARLMAEGRLLEPSQYSPEPNVITRALIEDGRTHLLMDQPYPFAGAVRILQGSADPDVPEAHVRTLAALIESPDLAFDLIPDGDHRLSRPQDLERLLAHAEALAR